MTRLHYKGRDSLHFLVAYVVMIVLCVLVKLFCDACGWRLP